MTETEIPPIYQNVLTSNPAAWRREAFYRVKKPTEGGEHSVSVDALVAKGEGGEWLSLQRNLVTRLPSHASADAHPPAKETVYKLNIVRETTHAGHDGPRKHYKVVAIIAGDKAKKLYEQLDKQVPSRNGHSDLEDALFMWYV